MVFEILEFLEPFRPVINELIFMSEGGLLSTLTLDLLKLEPTPEMCF